MGRRRVRLVAVGGTISSVSRGDGCEVTPALTARELVEAVPGLDDVADVELSDFATIASFAITLDRVHAPLALMVRRGRPVVLTVAMRNPSLPGADGPANVLAAFRVVSADAAREVGPVAVLGDEIHAARFATKAHISS